MKEIIPINSTLLIAFVAFIVLVITIWVEVHYQQKDEKRENERIKKLDNIISLLNKKER